MKSDVFFSHPPSNQLTRVQRCTCCFVLFIISMCFNTMNYDLSNQTKSSNSTDSTSLMTSYEISHSFTKEDVDSKSIKPKSVDNDGEYLHSHQVCLFIQRDPSRVNHYLLIDHRFVLIG